MTMANTIVITSLFFIVLLVLVDAVSLRYDYCQVCRPDALLIYIIRFIRKHAFLHHIPQYSMSTDIVLFLARPTLSQFKKTDEFYAARKCRSIYFEALQL